MIATRIILLSLLLPSFGCSRVDERVPVTTIAMDALVEAVRQYRAEFGAPPSGDSRAILRALRGENPTGATFLARRSGEAGGDFLDPWGNSYDLEVLPEGIVRVRSRGPDGRLGNGDDLELNDQLNRGTEP